VSQITKVIQFNEGLTTLYYLDVNLSIVKVNLFLILDCLTD